jgi:hypothetical protein
LAGKVAIERAYPDIRMNFPVKWRPGRPACGYEVESGPGGDIQTFREFEPFFKRYSFTPLEMGILLAGTHGLKEAVVHVNNDQRPWTTRNSGRDFVRQSLDYTWTYNDKVKLETAYIPHIFTFGYLVRLPVDMVFFPSAVAKVFRKPASVVADRAFLPVESALSSLARNETAFNFEFSKVYSKMLEIGVDGKGMGDWYVDTPKPHEK